MTYVLITIDTELSARLFQQGFDPAENFARSIDGTTGQGAVGIGWQMDRLDAHGLVGAFFVDPMPALVHGPEVIERTVHQIVARGHEAQLHLHPEWLEWATATPVGDRRGQNIGDFGLDDQITLIARARQILLDAGAPMPCAFRAGNYGADDNSLTALGALGFKWDSSFNPAYMGNPCRIGLPAHQVDPIERLGVVEVPVSAIHDRPESLRHAQICAMSSREMREAMVHAAANDHPVFTIVTHSFEMMSRDRTRPNRLVMKRFEAMCRTIAAHPGLKSTGFAGLELQSSVSTRGRLGANRMRTAFRHIEQAFSTLAYER